MAISEPLEGQNIVKEEACDRALAGARQKLAMSAMGWLGRPSILLLAASVQPSLPLSMDMGRHWSEFALASGYYNLELAGKEPHQSGKYIGRG
eukprot:15325604-Heterocapsa_arctica.AAC.1